MRIVVRVPTEQYAYVEVEFDSIEEYKKEYPKFAVTMTETRNEARKLIQLNEEPFK